MAGEGSARRLLRWDAAYCAAGGLVALSASRPLGALLGVPAAVLVAAGTTALAWAGVLLVLARRPSWRAPLATVAGLNAAAAAGAALLALAAPRLAAQLLLAAVACEVLVLAAAQAVALRR